MRRRLLILIFFPLLAACTVAAPLVAPTPTPMVFQPTLGRALAFLTRQLDAEVGLVRAAPDDPRHWLTPDNLLVEWVMQDAHAADLTVELETELATFGAPPHGLIETLRGGTVAWPPAVAVQHEVSPTVWLEEYTGSGAIDDWANRADFTFFAALNAWNQGDAAQAQKLFTTAMAMFDGVGFHDAANAERYATADLTLALLAGARLGEPVNDAIVRRLLSLQGADGGFAAHYTAAGPHDNADTRTTAFALLALYALRQPSQ
ncbi:MAG TPA: hypothetical protein DCL15_13810 [Chloroflexi bacterium]|nr:hypothetical protein [Chloroflexota bacterium]HHW86793.1 hypothetical protein [Chloroflexota bacterium]